MIIFVYFILFIRSLDKLNFTIYRKPTQNNRYLHFGSNHLPKVKRAVVISLVDRALNIGSDSCITAELNFITGILFGNGYPTLSNNNTINRRLKRNSRKTNGSLLCENPNKPSNIICLPYIRKITTNLKKVCTQNKLYLVFTINLKSHIS